MIELLINDGTSTYTYGPDRLAESSAATEARITEYRVELEDIELTVLPEGAGQSASAELAGYSDFTSIPEEVIWRAVVRRTDGKVLLNGAVRWEDIDYDRKTRTFGVRVYDRAPALFKSEANQYYVDRLAKKRHDDDGVVPQLSPVPVTTLIKTDDWHDSGNVENRVHYQPESWPAHTLTDVLDFAIDEVGRRSPFFDTATPGDRWSGPPDIPPGLLSDPDRPPTASFRITSKSAMEVTVEDTSSDPDQNLADATFEWGDGTSTTISPGGTTSHTYGSDGTYTITLTAEDDAGNTDQAQKEVSVNDAGDSPPTANFSVTDREGALVYFESTATDPDGDIVSYEWEWPDGETDTGETTAHSFSVVGDQEIVTVVHTVTDSNGNSNTIQDEIIVYSGGGGGGGPLSKSYTSEPNSGSTSYWPEPMFEVSYDRADQEVQVDFTPFVSGTGWGGLPGWTVDLFIQEILKYTGWRLRVQYRSFPSRTIFLTFTRQDWDGPERITSIDDTEQEGGSGERPGRKRPSWNLKMKGDLESAPEIGTCPLTPFDGPIQTQQPPPWALESPTAWNAVESSTEPETDGDRYGEVTVNDPRKIKSAETVESEFRLPSMFRPITNVTDDSLSAGWPIHPTAFVDAQDFNFLDYDDGTPLFVNSIDRPPVDRTADNGDEGVYLVDPLFQESGGIYKEAPLLGARERTYAVVWRRYWPAAATRPRADFSVSHNPGLTFTLEYNDLGAGSSPDEYYWIVPDAVDYPTRRGPGPHEFLFSDEPGVEKLARLVVVDADGAYHYKEKRINVDTDTTVSSSTAPTDTRTPTHPTDGLGMIKLCAPHVAYPQQTIRRGSTHLLEGDFRLSETDRRPTIGDPDDRVESRGKEWMLTRRRTGSITSVNEIEALRPTDTDPPPRPATPRYLERGWEPTADPGAGRVPGWKVQADSVEAAYETYYDNGSSTGSKTYLIVRWSPPEHQHADIFGYRVVAYDQNSNWQTFSAFVQGTVKVFPIYNAATNGSASEDNPPVDVNVWPISTRYVTGVKESDFNITT